ncbi:MAG: acyl-CoA dehydrogenase [Nevskiaceae bacterium]|nr:MAG: acyl-CoA dehydrogenase [Nevskiaceae bacterium]TBR72506.1 MAG: acyl-CoA dehydrogenase [Nevskiaceae bacterium]
MAIDFTLNAQQQALQKAARDFAEQVLTKVKPAIAGLARPEERFFATRPLYRQMVKAGYFAALIPREYGGGGATTVDLTLAAEEFARVDVNLPTTLLSSGLALKPLMLYGTDAQKRRFFGDFLKPEHDYVASFAFTEEQGGANLECPDPSAGIQTFARREGDEWIISGRKSHPTNGGGWDGKGAHLYAVLCRTDPSKPPLESSAIIMVPGDAEGIEVTGYIDTLGHRATCSPHIAFNEVRVPVENLVGRPGQGTAICKRCFSWTGALIGGICTGIMRAAFDCAYEFAKTDKRAGTVPIIDHPTVGYQLVDLRIRIEASRYLAWKASHYIDTTDYRGEELGIMAKIHCSESCVQAVYDAMRIVGVTSYSDRMPLAGLMQEALAFPIYDGGNMGVRRRWLYEMLKTPDYNPLAAAQGVA